MIIGKKRRMQKERQKQEELIRLQKLEEQKNLQKKKKGKKKKIVLTVVIACLLLAGIGSLFDEEPKQPDNSPTKETTAGVNETVTKEAVSEPIDTTPEIDTQPEKTPPPTLSLKDIPDYNGSEAYVAINDNNPSFTESDYQTDAFETYGDLDSLGRCSVAYANICIETMPTEERGSIGQVKPTGWQTIKYDSVDGKYLYNRCHLIGYQLSAENANTKNLITGTRYLNVTGMLPFENMVADYVKETNNHVLYRVTPIFDGDNLIATGVQMEAFSVEDNGEGICFNVFCYNVQPEISIDYATGNSSEKNKASKPEEKKPPAEKKPAKKKNNSSGSKSTYVLNIKTGVFHKSSCSSVKQMNEGNKQEFNGKRDELVSQGYDPCKRCHP